MHGSGTVGWLLVGLMGATGLFCLGRTLRPGAAPAERRLDGSEALKGLGMAAMALPYGLGRGVPVGVWAVLFGGAALWSLWAAAREGAGHRGHHLYHGVGHLAMVYMALAMAGAAGMSGTGGMAGMSGMSGGGGAELPALTAGLLVFFGGYALLSGVRLIAAPAAGATATGTVAGAGSVAVRLLGARELPHACRMVLGLGMFTMLLVM
ncbi:DUF5134 domain-containing protein [Streptacidiphilus cavernicola]|uniref:DUF5134 domain-containing protein n=1 Tax=Streptacidiphilus cavernicola TaxID=3342716 RepID=A0ABV6W4B0_9ACTN